MSNYTMYEAASKDVKVLRAMRGALDVFEIPDCTRTAKAANDCSKDSVLFYIAIMRARKSIEECLTIARRLKKDGSDTVM